MYRNVQKWGNQSTCRVRKELFLSCLLAAQPEQEFKHPTNVISAFTERLHTYIITNHDILLMSLLTGIRPDLCNLAFIKRSGQCGIINDTTSGNIDNAGALLDLAEGVIIEHALQSAISCEHLFLTFPCSPTLCLHTCSISL